MQRQRRSAELDGWWRRNQSYVVAAVVAAVGGAAAYKLYSSSSLAATQEALRKALATAQKYNDACSSTADALSALAADLAAYLQSDDDDVPQSLRQLAKLAQSADVQAAVSATTASAVQGVASVLCASPGDAQLPIIDRILEAMLSDRGRSLVGLALGAAARGSTEAFCDAVRTAVLQSLSSSSPAASSSRQAPPAGAGAATPTTVPTPCSSPSRQQQLQQQQRGSSNSNSSHSPLTTTTHPLHQHPPQQQPQHQQHGSSPARVLLHDLFSLLTSPRSQQLLNGLTATGVSAAVATYCDRAPQQGLFEPLLAAISHPQHKQALTDILSAVSTSFCREMAAACLAPAASVARSLSPGPSPTSLSPAAAAAAATGLALLPTRQHGAAAGGAALRRTRQGPPRAGSTTASDDGSSPPSSPRSGPGTPDATGLGVGCGPLGRAFGGGGGGGGASSSSQRSEDVGGAWGLQHAAAAYAAALPGPPAAAASGPWGPPSSVISLLVQASRSQELRSLMLDVTTSSTREFVAAVLPAGLLRGAAGPGGAALYSATFRLVLYRVYVLLSVLVFLAVYAASPRTLLAPGTL